MGGRGPLRQGGKAGTKKRILVPILVLAEASGTAGKPFTLHPGINTPGVLSNGP